MKLFSVVISAGITALACTCAASASVPSGQAFTAKQIFEGTVLGSGPVADIAQTTMHANAIVRGEGKTWRARADQLERALERADRGSIDAFGRDAASGDPGRLQRAFARIRTDLTRIGSLKTRHVAYGSNIAIAVVDANYDIDLVPPVFVVIDYGVVYVQPQPMLADTSTYEAERTIAAISERLKGRLAAGGA